MFTEVFREGVEILAQILEELLLLGRLLDLERAMAIIGRYFEFYCYYNHLQYTIIICLAVTLRLDFYSFKRLQIL